MKKITANKNLPIRNFLQKFVTGGVILQQLSRDDSKLWEFLETIILEFILYSLNDTDARYFLDLLESPTPPQDPLIFAQKKIPNFQKKLIKKIKESLKGVINTS